MTKHRTEGLREKCIVEDCDRDGFGPGCGRGYCAKHYQRWRASGTTIIHRKSNGGGHLNAKSGYVEVYRGRYDKTYEHILVAEEALGKRLPEGAVVHHVTENRSDNHGPFKLVICPNQAYHMLIHKLMREKGISFKTGWPND